MSEANGTAGTAKRRGPGRFAELAVGAAMLLAGIAPARAQSVTVAVDRSSGTRVVANLSGANVSSPDTPVNFGDPAVRSFVRPLREGILRWPGGTVNDFFDWRTGSIPAPAGTPTARTRPGVPTPIDIESAVFAPFPSIGFNREVAKATDKLQPILAGKGGNPLGDGRTGFAGFANAVGAKFLVVVNATTNTVEAAEQLAFAVARRGLPVAGFELVNEPFFISVPASQGTFSLPAGAPKVSGAYTDGADYLTKVKPYYDAIKRGFAAAGVDPARAVVAIAGGFAADTESWNVQWMQDISTYTRAHGTYWDAVAFHFYPPQSRNGTFADAMTYANDALAAGTDGFVAAYRAAEWSRGKPLFVSEYNVTLNDKRINGSVYAGVFSAEYVARMSLFPETSDVMLHELFNTSDGIGVPSAAIDGTGDWHKTLTAAGQAGQPIDTTGRITGLFYTAQILGLGLVNAAVNDSDRAYATRTTGAVGTVPTRTATLPAVYAQAYHARDGGLEVVVVNKGADPKLLQIVVDGRIVSAPLAVDWFAPTAGDPSESNTAAAQPVQLQHATVRGAVTAPGYSVMHLRLATP